MALSAKRFDQYAQRYTRQHRSWRSKMYTDFIASKRYQLRNPRQVVKMLQLRDAYDYLERKALQHSPQWITVIKSVRINDRQRWLVRLDSLPNRTWLAPTFALKPGTRIRGWITYADRRSSLVTSFSAVRIVWHDPSTPVRLIYEFFTHNYPSLHIRQVLRVPGLVTLIQVTAENPEARQLLYSPDIRQRLQRLFYQCRGAVPEAFRLALADLPLDRQAAHLMGIDPHHIRVLSPNRFVVTVRTPRAQALYATVARFLHCEIRLR